MCCVGLRPRTGSYRRSYSSTTRVSKNLVEYAIFSDEFECYRKPVGAKELESFMDHIDDLIKVLDNTDTKFKNAGIKSEYFLNGYKTIIMEAPNQDMYIFRKKF